MHRTGQTDRASPLPGPEQPMAAAPPAPEAFDLQRVAERAPDGGPPLEEDEELAQAFPRVALVLGSGHDLGDGTLFITTRRAPPAAGGRGQRAPPAAAPEPAARAGAWCG